MNFWRLAFAGMSPGGSSARLTVAMYHRVVSVPDPLFPEVPDASSFAAQMTQLRTWFNVLPLDQAITRLTAGNLPARSLAVTFDDGYADNQIVALPILERLGLHATFFITTGFLDGGMMWNDTVIEAVRRFNGDRLDLCDLGLEAHSTATPFDRRRTIDLLISRIKYLPPGERETRAQRIAQRVAVTLPRDLMLRSAQVRDMHARGMGIGAHTVSHPILANLSDNDARMEMAESKARLEALVGASVDLFAYPNGKAGEDYRQEHVAMARQLGFRAAFSTLPGAVYRDSDLYQLPRFTPWSRKPSRAALQFLRNLTR
jgi:peptidoglycan/xylan/chitin deacetylase (PgdA/CDA1 family)